MIILISRAANTFSDSFLPGVHKSLDQGHQGSQSPTRNKRRFKSKKHHQSSANFVDVIQGKFSKFEKVIEIIINLKPFIKCFFQNLVILEVSQKVTGSRVKKF